MLSPIEKMLFLKSVDLLTLMSDEDFLWITDIAQDVHFGKGEQFIREGDPGDCLYIAVSGEIDVFVEGIGRVATCRERDVIGEMALLSGSPRTSSCIAATEVTAIKITRRLFIELLREKPELALGIIRTLVHRLETKNKQAKR